MIIKHNMNFNDERELDFINNIPFKVMWREFDNYGYFFIKGDVDLKTGKNIFVCRVDLKGEDKDVQMKSRLQDMEYDYKQMTGTDGSKVNWNYTE